MTDELFCFPKVKERYLDQYCEILSTASYLPAKIISNQDIITEYQLNITDQVIQKTLGIQERRVADSGLTDSDLLAEACRSCLAKAGVAIEQVSRLIVTKFMGDNLLPMTASRVQKKLGSRMAIPAYDLEGGINSLLQAFDLASRYIATGDEYVLIASGGIMYDLVSKINLRTAFLFGDAAGAVLIGKAVEKHIMASYFYSNHAYFSEALGQGVTKGYPDDLYESEKYELLYDNYELNNWKNSIDFCLQAARVVAANLLQESCLSMEEIDWVLVTENNKQIRNLILEALDVKPEKSISLIQKYGNTMSAMLALLLDKGFDEGLLKKNDRVMLLSYGEGASGGGMIYKI